MKRGKKLIGLVVAVILGLSLILVPMVSRVSPAQAAVTWTKYSGEVTMDSELYVVDAWVIKESSTSYKMWYTHAKKNLTISEIINGITALNLDALIGDIANLDLAQFLNHLSDLAADVSAVEDLLDGISTVIGYATSTDGKIWTKVNSEVLAGSGGAWESVGAPCVIKESDTSYKMWYTRIKTDLTQASLQAILNNIASTNTTTRKNGILDLLDSTSTVIGYATWDGVSANWAVQDSEVLPGSSSSVWESVADPCVIKNSDTDYEMWYTRPTTNLTQTDLDTILADIGNFGIDDLLDILDGTSSVIGYATSNNGWDWAVQDSQVLPVGSGIGAWNSVANPSVVKTGSSYEMWYTNVKTNLIAANLGTLASEIGGLDIAALWTTLKGEGLVEFIVDLVALDIDTIKGVLSNTSTVIGYTTSSDGANWTVQNSQHLVGSSITPWSGVAAPSVVRTGDRYEMWYTEGIGELTWQNLLDLILGDNLPIGYASYTVPAPPPPPPPPPPGITDVSGVITGEGVFTEEVTAKSEDENVGVTIDEGTIGLTAEGEPLSEISIIEMEEPPAPPEDSNIIGLAYDFGPDGATFDPPIILTFTYDEALIPEDVAEENLVIAIWDEEAGGWVNLVCTVDPETNTITAEVSHFTAFAIITVVPVVVPPAPAAFSVSSLSIQPAEVEPAEVVTIAVSVANTGGESGSYTVVLKINGVKEAEERVTIAAGSSQTVTFSVTKEEAGSYTVTVDGLSGSFTVVAPPAPAAFSVSSLSIQPAEVEPGETVTIAVLVANTGGESGSYTVVLKIDGVKEAEKSVTIAPGESQDVSFSVTREEAGSYTVAVSGLTGSFTVKEKVVPPVVPKPIAWWVWLIVGLGVVVIGGLLAYFLWWRRRIA